MKKPTKYCELTVHLQTGATIKGRFHVGANTSATIRPSDALRECKDGLLLLSEAVLTENGQSRSLPAILVHLGSMLYAELPSSWISSEAQTSPLQSLVAKPIIGMR